MNKWISFIVAILLSVLVPATSQARYLNPNNGRFQTMDSYAGNNSDPLSLHKYLYAHANPVMGTDPSGHHTMVEVGTVTTLMVLFSLHEARTANAALKGARGVFGSTDGVDSLIYALDVVNIFDEKVGQVALGTAAVTVGYKAVRYGIPALVRGGLKLGRYISQLGKEASDGKILALGLDAHLGQFADTVDYTFFTNGSKELAKWKEVFDQVMGNVNNRIVFILDDLDIWSRLQAVGAGQKPSATDWELLMIKENPQWWDRISWVKEGKVKPNPFEQ